MRHGWTAGAVLAALLATAALTPMAAVAGTSTKDEIAALKRQMAQMAKRLQELEAKQNKTEKDVQETKKNAVLSKGSTPGSFVIPGTNTEVEISGYVKADFIYDANESTGDIFVPEAISTRGGNDQARFRAHARQSRLRVKTRTPTPWGDLKTHLEGDFFGAGGNQVFSNSTSLRLRHAYASVGGLLAGQTWTNFMPIESYPTTVDFNGPAGLPFIRQAQIRYTYPLSDGLTISASVENSEFSGRNAAGTVSESTGTAVNGIRAGLDQLPDFTAALRYKSGYGFLKVAGVARKLGSPNGAGDDSFAWGVNVSGNTSLWPGGKVLASFTYGDGVGRYLINGFGQDAFVKANGDVQTIEAYGVAAQVQQKLTDELTLGVAYGRSKFKDTFGPTDLDNVNTVHGTLLWSPIKRLTFGAEVIWGNREDADGADDSALRFQGAVQVNF